MKAWRVPHDEKFASSLYALEFVCDAHIFAFSSHECRRHVTATLARVYSKVLPPRTAIVVTRKLPSHVQSNSDSIENDVGDDCPVSDNFPLSRQAFRTRKNAVGDPPCQNRIVQSAVGDQSPPLISGRGPPGTRGQTVK